MPRLSLYAFTLATTLAPANTSVSMVCDCPGATSIGSDMKSDCQRGVSLSLNEKVGWKGCLPEGTSATAQYLSVIPSHPSVDFDGLNSRSFSIVAYFSSVKPSEPV